VRNYIAHTDASQLEHIQRNFVSFRHCRFFSHN